MRQIRAVFRWLTRPQALLGFVVICLSIGGIGAAMCHPAGRTSAADTVLPPPAPPALAGVNCRARPCLAITFDDGPEPTITPQILDILARYNAKATFFVIGRQVPGQEGLLQRMRHEGHEIGNHSWSHPDLSGLPPEAVTDQLQATQRAIAAAGVPVPRLLRPPYGAVNDMMASHNRLTIVRWNVDPEDWKPTNPEAIAAHIIAHAHPGAIVLLHDIRPQAVIALEKVLLTLHGQYQFVTASQVLGLSPGDQGQYFGH